jgi:predicted NAD/FAD-dependent oxidoreductase
MRVILIGAGISGALISLLLRRQFGPGIKLVVFDKARNIGKNKLFLIKFFDSSISGGRMTTSYDSEENLHCSVDTGAQYLTLTKSNGITTK